MKKCPNCQTEFDGDICPNCQTTAENKTDNKVATKPTSGSFKDKVCGFVDKYYTKLKLVPPIAFFVYMALSALFLFVCPVAVVKVAGVKYGTVFNGKLFNEIPGLNNVATALRIVAIFALIYTLVYVLYRFVSLKYARVGKVRVSFILEIISAVLVFAFFIFACIIAGMINTADKGISLVLVGSYSILTIILSIFALMLIITTIIACFLHEKHHPELEEEFDKKYEIAKEKEKKRKKKEISTRQKISGVIAGILCIVCIFICLGSAGLFSFDKSFNAKKLRSMVFADNGQLSITKTELEKKLGDSFRSIDEVNRFVDEEKKNSDTYTYYTSNYVTLSRKYERYSKYNEKAMEKGNVDEDTLADWFIYEAQLLEDGSNMTYGKAIISFDDNKVVSVIYTVHSPNSSRKLINTKVMNIVESNATDDKKQIDSLVFMATYSDGSFAYAIVKGGIRVELPSGGTDSQYEGSYKDYKIIWSYDDDLGENNYEFGTTTK